MKGESGLAASSEQQISAKRCVVTGNRQYLPGNALARHKMAALVKFAVVGEINFWHDAENAPAVNDDRAIVEVAAPAQRRSDDKNRQALAARQRQSADFTFDRVKQGILKQQIVDCIGR